jgi:DNA-directed RNA polymerase beta' subunit
MNMENNDYYVYVYLNQTKMGKWMYNEHEFEFQPFYVGKGRRKREIMHLCPFMLKAKTYKNSIIKSIINKTNEQPIHYRLYENLSNDEAIAFEIDIINHFGRLDNGSGILANGTDGGDGANNFSNETCKKIGKKKKVYQYSLDGEFIKEWDGIKSIGGSYSNMSTSIKRNGTYDNYIWSYVKLDNVDAKIKYQMPVKYENIKQIDIETGEIKHTFANALEIITELKLVSSARGKIYDCINNKIKTAYGYKWKI